MQTVVAWYVSEVSSPYKTSEEEPGLTVSSVYHAVFGNNDGVENVGTQSPSIDAGKPLSKGTDTKYGLSIQIFDENLANTAASLLVAVHSDLSEEDWTVLFPHVWHCLSDPDTNLKAVGVIH